MRDRRSFADRFWDLPGLSWIAVGRLRDAAGIAPLRASTVKPVKRARRKPTA